jgi:hypothetical protein
MEHHERLHPLCSQVGGSGSGQAFGRNEDRAKARLQKMREGANQPTGCLLMTAFLPGLLTGFALGLFAVGMLITLLRLHKTPPPTFYRRRNRDAPERKLFDEIKEGVADPERERNGGVDYRFINLTGLEDK